MIISPGIGCVFICYILLFFAYLGWGRIGAYLLGIDLQDRATCIPYVWLGWAISIILLQTVHLVLPLNQWVSGVFFLLGIAGNFTTTFSLRNSLERLSQISCGYWLFLLMGGCWIAGHALLEPKLYDSGVYHFNSVRWLLEYPLVTGLGNLHGRLAFNQTFFIFVASLEVFQPLVSGHNLANSFLLYLALAECAYPLFNRVKISTDDRLILIVKIAFIPLVLVLGKNYALSSPSPDLCSTILRIVMFYHFIEVLVRFRSGQKDTGGVKYSVLLASVAITIKLSNVMYAISLGGICVLLGIARRNRLSGERGKVRIIIFAIILFFLTIWAVRGVVLSGCLVYPSSAFCFDLDWAIPKEQVTKEAEMIYRSQRTKTLNKDPRDFLLDRKWMVRWVDTMWRWKSGFAYPVILALAAICGAVASVTFSKDTEQRKSNLLLTLAIIPPLTAIVFWFVTAPHIRFAEPFLFLIALAGFLPWLRSDHSSKVRLMFTVMVLAFINIPLLLAEFERGLRFEVVMRVSPEGEPTPKTILGTFKTASGLEIYFPVKGDQCWDSALPCSPSKDENLRLRGDSLRTGFISRKIE